MKLPTNMNKSSNCQSIWSVSLIYDTACNANYEIGRNSGSIKSNTLTTHQRLAKKRRFSDGTSPLLFDREVLAEADKCERFAAARSMQSRRRS